MTAVYRGDTDALYLERPDGAFDVVLGDARAYALALPDAAVELLDPDEGRAAVLDDVRAAVAPIKMSKTARAALEAALDDLGGPE